MVGSPLQYLFYHHMVLKFLFGMECCTDYLFMILIMSKWSKDQSGDEIIYLSSSPMKNIFYTKMLIRLFIYKNIYYPPPDDLLVAPSLSILWKHIHITRDI